MTTNKITVRGILRGGKTLALTEDTQLPEHLPEVPVTVQIELPVGIGVLQAYGICKDDPDFDSIERDLEELRYGKRSDQHPGDEPPMATPMTLEQVEALVAQLSPREQQQLVAHIRESLSAMALSAAPGPAMTAEAAQQRVAQAEAWLAKLDTVAESIAGEFDSAEDLREIREQRASRL